MITGIPRVCAAVVATMVAVAKPFTPCCDDPMTVVEPMEPPNAIGDPNVSYRSVPEPAVFALLPPEMESEVPCVICAVRSMESPLPA